MRLTANRIALIGSVLAAALHIVLLGQVFRTEQSIAVMRDQVDTLLTNIAGLRQIEDGQLEGLKEELAEARDEVKTLEAAFPVPGAPFALYDRAFAMAAQNNILIISISRLDRELLDSAFGMVDSSHFSVNAEATLEDCMEFIDRLEKAGINTLAVDNIVIEPENLICDFDVQTLGTREGS